MKTRQTGHSRQGDFEDRWRRALSAIRAALRARRRSSRRDESVGETCQPFIVETVKGRPDHGGVGTGPNLGQSLFPRARDDRQVLSGWQIVLAGPRFSGSVRKYLKGKMAKGDRDGKSRSRAAVRVGDRKVVE